MTKPVSIPNAFATQSGNVPAAQLDADFQSLATVANDLGTYNNTGVDTGTANSYVVNFAGTPVITVALAMGLPVSFMPANANTGASTLNVQGTGAVALVRPDLTPLASGDLLTTQVYTVVYNASANAWAVQNLFNTGIYVAALANPGRIVLPKQANPAVLQPPIIQFGSVSGTASSGFFSFNFQGPFLNNVFTVVPSAGDNVPGNLIVQNVNSGMTLSGAQVACFQGGSAFSGTVRINYIAVGN